MAHQRKGSNPLALSKGYLLLSFLILSLSTINAQHYVREYVEIPIELADLADKPKIDIPKFSTLYGCKWRVHKVVVTLEMDMHRLHSKYIFDDGVGHDPELVFSFNLDFLLTAYRQSALPVTDVFGAVNRNITIHNKQPVILYQKDITDWFNNELAENNIAYIQLEDGAVTPETHVLRNNVGVTLRCEIEYAYDVRYDIAQNDNEVNVCQLGEVVMEGRKATFNWNHLFPFTNYQIQVQRVYNTSENLKDGELADIELDWSRSAPIDVLDTNVLDNLGVLISNRSFELTLGEGSGIYAWRVRPVGNFHKGGKANGLNMGPWSEIILGSTIIPEDYDNTIPGIFLFEDPDDGYNRTYGRVYTEDNKNKETAAYADGLLNTKQTQTYLPSNNVSVLSQSVQDYTGRTAVSVLPVVVDDQITQYRNSMVRSGTDPYTAENLNTSTTKVPDQMNETGDMDYYNNNPDPRIPDAEGKPFSGVTYYDDPLNRVMEEYGPGAVHSKNEEGTGKTVKYYYRTATETELTRLFGSEAPNHENVLRTTKIDQNNIATISYTNVEGQVLATALSFYESAHEAMEDLDITNIQSFPVDDYLTNGVQDKLGAVSVKRLVVMQNTDLQVDYKIKERTLSASCLNINVECNYVLDVYLYDFQDKKRLPLLEGFELKDAERNGEYLIVDVKAESSNKENFNLAPGSYIIEKRITSPRQGKNGVNYEAQIREKIEPLARMVKSWLDEVTCPKMALNYYDDLGKLRDVLTRPEDELELSDFMNNRYGSGNWPDYMKTFYDKEYKLENNYQTYKMFFYSYNSDGSLVPTSRAGRPDIARIESPCCDFEFNVEYFPKPRLYAPSLTAGAYGEANKTEPMSGADYYEKIMNDEMVDFVPDFEGYAAYLFKGHRLGDDVFYDYMKGWYSTDDRKIPKGTFNLMVYHMLTDRYSCDNTTLEQDKKYVKTSTPKLNECGEEINKDCEECIYDPEELFDCWKGVLTLLLTRLDQSVGDAGYDFGNRDMNNLKGSDEVDDLTEELEMNGEGNYHDELFDNIPGVSFLTSLPLIGNFHRWALDELVSSQIRKLDPLSATILVPRDKQVKVEDFHLVKEFLECTGYRFAKILTPYDPQPLEGDIYGDNDPIGGWYPYYNQTNLWPGSKHKYMFPFAGELSVNCARYFETNEFRTDANEYDRYYIPLTDWQSIKVDEEKEQTLSDVFPMIRNPIYAYKYFSYDKEGTEEYLDLEATTCYDDPNDCYKIVNGKIAPDPNGGMLKIPCCLDNQLSKPSQVDFCFLDTKYPNLDDIFVTNDDRFGYDQNGNAGKWLVHEFVGVGRLKCPYTHEQWSCGQRNVFYQKLKDFKPATELASEGSVSRSCNNYGTGYLWYSNKKEDGTKIVKSLPYAVTDVEKGTHELEQITEFPDIFSPLENIHVKNDFTEEYKISIAEWEIARMRRDCMEKAMARKDEVREYIVAMLRDKCYEVDGCMGADAKYSVSVPESDIDVMVDKVMEQIQSQCMELNSCSCEQIIARYKDASKLLLSGEDSEAVVDYPRSNFGMGEYPNYGAYPGDSHFETVVMVSHEGSNHDPIPIRKYYDYKPNSNSSGYDVSEFSWYQHTLMEQVKNWDFEIDIPSKCNQLRLEAEKSAGVSDNVQYHLDMLDGFKTDDWAKFDKIEFGNNPVMVKIRYAMQYEQATSGSFKIYKDYNETSKTGVLVATINVANTANEYQFVEQEATLVGTLENKPTLHIVAENDNGAILKLDYIHFYDFDDENQFSHSRQFDHNNSNTFLPRNEYETNGELEDYNRAIINNPAYSPGITISIPNSDLE